MNSFYRKITKVQVISYDSSNTSLWKIIFSILAISLIRAFIEQFSNEDPSGYFYSFPVVLHFFVYFLALFLNLLILVYFFTKQTFFKIANYESKIFIVVLIAPIMDLLFTHGKGSTISYVLTEYQNFGSYFFKLLIPWGYEGVTFGVHIAAYLLLLFLSLFVYEFTKSFNKTLLFVLSGYIVFFFHALTPSFFSLFESIKRPGLSAVDAFNSGLNDSWLKTFSESSIGLPNFGHLTTIDVYLQRNLYAISLTQILFLFIMLQTFLLTRIYVKEIFSILKKEIRIERIFVWLSIASLGIYFSFKINDSINLFNSFNIVTLLTFFFTITLNIWIAACINDIEDVDIDKISNPERPLAKGLLKLSQFDQIKLVLIFLAVIGLVSVGKTVAFCIMLSQASYYLYSSNPLRQKRNFISSSLFTGFAASIILMSGFYLVSPNQKFNAFPVSLFLIVGSYFAFIFNVKDIKDYEGDSKNFIKTLPVVFGLKKSKIILSIFCSLIFVSIPFYLKSLNLIPLTISSSFFMTYLLNKKEYNDKQVFFFIFFFIASVIILTA